MESSIIRRSMSRSITESSKDRFEVLNYMSRKITIKNADKFLKLLESIRFQWVKINRGGPESLEGVLSDANMTFCLTDC